MFRHHTASAGLHSAVRQMAPREFAAAEPIMHHTLVLLGDISSDTLDPGGCIHEKVYLISL